MTSKRFARVFLCGLLVVSAALLAHFSVAAKPPADSDLAVHEWGTFTSIAGADGRAVSWEPLTGPPELPGFVESNPYFPKIGLSGTIRMETPVIYFHAARAMTVSVHVSFAEGVITEWYPHAASVLPSGNPTNAGSAAQTSGDGSIAWDSIVVDPSNDSNFPREGRDNRYYAARDTSATPLRASAPSGVENEKFLFYRGVSRLPLPISAKMTPDGDALEIRNVGKQAIPSVILFERRGQKLGYRMGANIQNEVTMNPPALTGSLDSLNKDLENILVTQGLYADEARAMVRTWNDSWFEEGSRLIYIVPAEFVNRILPLSINPAPGKTTRVFVGRLELMTPATEHAIESAFESHDGATLRKYGRFLAPFLEEMIRATSDEDRQEALKAYLDSAHNYITPD